MKDIHFKLGEYISPVTYALREDHFNLYHVRAYSLELLLRAIKVAAGNVTAAWRW